MTSLVVSPMLCQAPWSSGSSRVIRCSRWLWKQVEYCKSRMFPRSLFWWWRSARSFNASCFHMRLMFFFENCFAKKRSMVTQMEYLHVPATWSARYCQTISNSLPFPPDLSESSVCTILWAFCKCLQSKIQRMFGVTTLKASPAEAWQSLTRLTQRATEKLRTRVTSQFHRFHHQS